jgi:hypothetical protein
MQRSGRKPDTTGMERMVPGAATAAGRPRAAVLLGAFAGTLAAAFVLQGGLGRAPADGFAAGREGALNVEAVDRHAGGLLG